MPGTRHIDNKRDALLDAAERVAVRLGAAHLTLDVVAKEAKIAKGGLIYHFPSKKALFQAMLDRALAIYRESAQASLADPSNHGDWVLSQIRLVPSLGKRLEQLSTLIITIAGNYPELLQPLEKRNMAFYEQLAKNKSGDRAMIAMLAVHGLFLMERLGIKPLKQKKRAQLIQALCTFVGEEG